MGGWREGGRGRGWLAEGEKEIIREKRRMGEKGRERKEGAR